MKRTVLLYENDPAVIEQFFTQLGDRYTILTSTNRLGDLENHIKLLKPDFLVYSLANSGRDDLEHIYAVKDFLAETGTKLCITGTPYNCDYFVRNSRIVADFMLMKPMKTSDIIATLESAEDLSSKSDSITPSAEPAAVNQGDTSPAAEQAVEPVADTGSAPAEQAADLSMNSVFSESLDAVPGAEKPAEAKPAAPAAPHKHILVIDDNPMMLKIIKQHLHDMYDVATAPGGEIALKFLETRNTDMILLDFEMPGMNGPEVMRHLHNNPKTRNIPVVFLTGTKDKAKVQQALLMKPQGYLLKPIDKVKLIAMIKTVIG